LKDLVKFISLKIDLEDDQHGSTVRPSA
jgi:hypothetical protein